jgi:hypothetical protein
MAVGLAAGVANGWLNAIGRATNYTAPVGFFAKLHLGDPGAAGTANAAANTTRQAATMAAASAGTMTSSADVTWTSVSNSETYAYLSFWSAVSSGTFLASVALAVPQAVTAGQNFTVAAGNLNLNLVVIAA